MRMLRLRLVPGLALTASFLFPVASLNAANLGQNYRKVEAQTSYKSSGMAISFPAAAGSPTTTVLATTSTSSPAFAGSTTTVQLITTTSSPASVGSTTSVPRTATTVKESVTTTTRVPATGYDVRIEKTGASTLIIGQIATFILKPYNTGPSTVSSSSGIVVTDLLSAPFTTPVTANGSPGWNCSVSGLLVSCFYIGGSVNAGQPMPGITITAMTSKLGEGKNCAKITIEVTTDTKPSDNTDCFSLIVKPVGRPPTLTIRKILIPSNNPGRFNLKLDTVVKASSVGNGGNTGAITTTVGTHLVSESASAPTSMANYTQTFSGACDFFGSVTLVAGDNKTCIITNKRNPIIATELPAGTQLEPEDLLPPTCHIGDIGPGGGIVFYVSASKINVQPKISSGGRCLEAAPNSWNGGTFIGPTYLWGCSGVSVVGTGIGIGIGASNTAKFVNSCINPNSPARVAADLVFGGKNDWFVPSKAELNLIYTNLKIAGIGGFTNNYYWSSSENNSLNVWLHDFNNGALWTGAKASLSIFVTVIRAFG